MVFQLPCINTTRKYSFIFIFMQLEIKVNEHIFFNLIELPVSSSGHGWIIPSVYFGNVITLYALSLCHCHVTCKRNLCNTERELNPAKIYSKTHDRCNLWYHWYSTNPVRVRSCFQQLKLQVTHFHTYFSDTFFEKSVLYKKQLQNDNFSQSDMFAAIQ